MKTNHSPRGTRVVVRVLFYTLLFTATIGIRETFRHVGGPVTTAFDTAVTKVISVTTPL